MADLTRIFISYSRADSTFADRLEADLRARGFDTWVDRRRLEGGQEWKLEIEHAINRSDLMLVALSPEAEASPWVKLEYERALGQAKPLIPLIYRECHIPDGLASIQAESLVGLPYNQSILKTLDRLTRLLDPSLALPTDLGELYRRALAAERSDPEQASRLLQRLVDRDAAYAGGEPTRDLARVNEKLLPTRVERLRREAQAAHQSGEYGREAGALEALVALAPNDAWAKEYLPTAQTNRRYLDLYAAIQHLIEIGDTDEARDKLTRLWQDAPYFRDPAGIAPKLGLQIPPTYEEVKVRKAAEDRRAAAEQARAAEAKQKRKVELQAAETRKQVELQAAETRKQEAQAQVQRGNYKPNNAFAEYQHWKAQAQAASTERARREQQAADLKQGISKARTWASMKESILWKLYLGCLVLGFLISLVLVTLIGPSVDIATTFRVQASGPLDFQQNPGPALGFAFGFGILLGMVAYLSVYLFLRLKVVWLKSTAAGLEQTAQHAGAQANHWSQQLQAEKRPHLADIEADYQRELADIERRYGSA